MIFFIARYRVVSWVGPQWRNILPPPPYYCIICLRNVNLAVRGEALCRGDFISKTNFRLHISDYRFYLNIGNGSHLIIYRAGAFSFAFSRYILLESQNICSPILFLELWMVA